MFAMAREQALPAPAHPAVPPPHPAARLEMGEAIREFYGEDPKQSPDYGRVINDRNFERLAGFPGSGTIAVGGQTDAEQILDATESGDAAVNDCSIQPLIPELPFGGVGNSGMGKYHGRYGFEAFTSARGVLYHGAKARPRRQIPPYSEHERMHGLIGKLMP